MSNNAKILLIFIGLGIIGFFILLTVAIFSPTPTPNDTKNNTAAAKQDKPKLSEIEKIEKNDNFGLCVFKTDPNDVPLSVGVGATQATTDFINKARKLFSRKTCTDFVYEYKGLATDSRGNEEPTVILSFSAEKGGKFSQYDWNNLVGESVGLQLKRDGILTINRFPDEIKYSGLEYLGR